MDGTQVTTIPGEGQEKDTLVDVVHLFKIDLVKEEIFKYLDGSALINLSSVNNTRTRHLVTSSKQYKKCVNLRVSTKTMDFFTTGEPLPGWTKDMTNLTLVCNSDMFIISPQKFSSFSSILPNLTTLEILNESQSYTYVASFLNKILALSSNIKSLSLPYDFLLNPLEFGHGQNLKELKLTTFAYEQEVEGNQHFVQNLDNLANNCVNLKSLSVQELSIVEGRYLNDDQHEYFYSHGDFDGILKIIENNSAGLEKLEFGMSGLLTANEKFSSKFAKISFSKLNFLDLRAVQPDSWPVGDVVMDILNNLPHPGLLRTLKLTLTTFPPQLFALIPQKFPQLKSLSLKASRFVSNYVYNRDFISTFCTFLRQLEEFEITRFIIEYSNSNFSLEDMGQFREHFLQNNISHNNLRKLSLNCVNQAWSDSASFYSGIAKMIKLKELALTGCPMYIDDFIIICSNLKLLEKLKISYLYSDQFNPESTHESTTDEEIDYSQISTAFLSLKYLKEVEIELCYTDFTSVLGSTSFPYLKSFTLVNETFGDERFLQNIVGLNPMLKKLTFVTYQEDQRGNFDMIGNERNNFKIESIFKQIRIGPNGGQYSDDCDPDSRPLAEREINWPAAPE